MKAALFNGNDLVIETVNNPTLTPSQVLIQVKAVGLCGTDLAIVEGHLPTPTPIIIGHEFAGIIVKVGDNVDSAWIGKRVVSEINSNIDFSCYYCERYIFTQCISRKAIGIDIDGALAEFIAVESYLIHEIPDSLSFNDATFVEPLAAAYQTFEMMPIEDDDNTIAIFGLGKLGLLILQIAVFKNLKVIAIDGSEKKLRLAEKFGALKLINRLQIDNISQRIREFTNNLGADIVIDCSGSPNALVDIVSSCKTRGKIHIKSTHGLGTPIDLTDLVVREITIYTSRCGPFSKAIEGLEKNHVSVKELISDVYKLENVKEAFTSYKINRDMIKIIISFEN
jgi:threonine dehydrogenase-like Zn-dependent dehydrogenase